MFKKILYVMLLAIILFIFMFIFVNKKDIEEEKLTEPPKTEDEVPSAIDNNDNHENYIAQIISLAKQGMIMNVSAVAGETTFEEVVEKLGTPDRIDETVVGNYAIYNEPNITVGYKDSIAYDLRSYEKALENVYYEDILEHLGEPDDIKYYQDNQFEQIILIYDIANYQLKWILDRPSEDNENPTVHHICVVAQLTSENIQNSAIQEQIQQMSLDEKIGQLIFAGISGTELNSEGEKVISDYKVGGLIFYSKNMTSPTQTVSYINELKALNRKHDNIPLFFGVDQEGGRVAKLPGDVAKIPSAFEIGRVGNPAFSYEIGRVLGQSVKAFGFNINFAPVLDINNNPNNPVIGDRSFGSSESIVSELGIEMMLGIQEEGVIPTIKHFPGHGDTTVDSHFDLPTINKSLEQLENLEIIPFRNAIEEGADMVMVAHLLLPQIDDQYPSSLSEEIITNLLRNGLNYDGVVITDDLTMEAITKHFVIGQAAVQSIKAGSDIVMVAHEYENLINVYEALKNAVVTGEISEDRIDESVSRILKLKKKYELNDKSVEDINIQELNEQIGTVLDKYFLWR